MKDSGIIKIERSDSLVEESFISKITRLNTRGSSERGMDQNIRRLSINGIERNTPRKLLRYRKTTGLNSEMHSMLLNWNLDVLIVDLKHIQPPWILTIFLGKNLEMFQDSEAFLPL
jgi:hypothetical protein